MLARSKDELFYGLDVGSTTVKIAVLDANLDVIYQDRTRTHGRPLEATMDLFGRLSGELKPIKGARLAVTGTGGKLLSQVLGGHFINEIIAHTEAATREFPTTRTLLDMGGQDTKLVILSQNSKGRLQVEDFNLNTLCAAGTGAFLDQQAARLGLSIEEFSTLALKSHSPASLAGRCTVFAKSDMIHLQQAAVPDCDIVAGLCLALVRNIKATIARGKKVLPPLVFQGGVAENVGVRMALIKIFKIPEEQLFVPKHFRTMGAIGAILNGLRMKALRPDFKGLEALEDFLRKRPVKVKRLAPLVLPGAKRPINIQEGSIVSGSSRDILLGIDVGSISTKMVAIDPRGNILAHYYGKTAGSPLKALKKGLHILRESLGMPYNVAAVGTTGSGRYLAGDFVGADTAVNEITAQARAAIELDPDVDTIFEIGGQDSKYIRVSNGTVIDFMMNRACAAGTGSFLEEQAGRLGIDLMDFGRLALSAKAPVKMGERCTVFMESDLVHYLQQGVEVSDLVAGLCYGIVYNYLNKVVEDRPIGNKIFYQGATALNHGVVAAFKTILGKDITVPKRCDLTGALGAALIARERSKGTSRFRGFKSAQAPYKVKSFECKACPNQCSISRVSVEGRRPLFYGGRCERYEAAGMKRKKADLPDLVDERQRRLFSYCLQDPHEARQQPKGAMGIPFALVMQEWLPLIATFLKGLGFGPVISGPTTKSVIQRGIETMVTEPCFPVKIAHGHVLSLLEMGIERVFLPSFIDFPSPNGMRPGQACPYVQSLPYTLQAAIDFQARGAKLLSIPLRLGRKNGLNTQTILGLSRLFRSSPWQVKDAWNRAWNEQIQFAKQSIDIGRQALDHLEPGRKAIVLVGRPYNALDPGANLGIHEKLLGLGVLPLPIDYLDTDRYLAQVPSFESMYWRYGQRILSSAVMVRNDDRLKAIYVTNFGCGPDSFLLHRFQDIMEPKPFLELEIDEHSADAGALTRIEAYLDTSTGEPDESIGKKRCRHDISGHDNLPRRQQRTIFIPPMSDHAYALAAAMRACGCRAKVLPPTDEESAALGLKHTSGKECYPAILTTGDLIKMTQLPDFAPESAAFFMPCGGGPCRFGQYPSLHRRVLDNIGLEDVPILSLNQDVEFYSEASALGKGFTRLAWQGIVAVDLLDRLTRSIRPYARERDLVDRIYRDGLKAIVRAVEERRDLEDVLDMLRRRLQRVERDDSIPCKPTIGIVGEIYTRANSQANAELIKELESLGVQVALPSVSEWILYTNFTAMRRARRAGSWKEYLKLNLENMIQVKDVRRLERAIGRLPGGREPMISEILSRARPFLSDEFEGETILSVGKAVEFLREGVAGLINVMPFSCMPGTIVNALLKRVRDELGPRPFLPLACDGQQETLRSLRLEAFVYQAMESAVPGGGSSTAECTGCP